MDRCRPGRTLPPVCPLLRGTKESRNSSPLQYPRPRPDRSGSGRRTRSGSPRTRKGTAPGTPPLRDTAVFSWDPPRGFSLDGTHVLYIQGTGFVFSPGNGTLGRDLVGFTAGTARRVRGPDFGRAAPPRRDSPRRRRSAPTLPSRRPSTGRTGVRDRLRRTATRGRRMAGPSAAPP